MLHACLTGYFPRAIFSFAYVHILVPCFPNPLHCINIFIFYYTTFSSRAMLSIHIYIYFSLFIVKV